MFARDSNEVANVSANFELQRKFKYITYLYLTVVLNLFTKALLTRWEYSWNFHINTREAVLQKWPGNCSLRNLRWNILFYYARDFCISLVFIYLWKILNPFSFTFCSFYSFVIKICLLYLYWYSLWALQFFI